MNSPDSLPERIAETARQLQDHQADPEGTFQLAVELAWTTIDGCDGAGLSFVRPRKAIETMASTDQWVADAESLQHELREGPCLDAIREKETASSARLGEDPRWPLWGPRVAEMTGARSVLSCRLFTHGDVLGALTLYSRTPDAFDADAHEEGVAIAAHVAIAIAASQEIHHLSVGLDTRTVIGQATGLLMERFDLDAARAFAVLARLSSQHNTKLRTLAAEVVANRHRHDPTPRSDGAPAKD